MKRYRLLKSTDNFCSSKVIFLMQKDKYIFCWVTIIFKCSLEVCLMSLYNHKLFLKSKKMSANNKYSWVLFCLILLFLYPRKSYKYLNPPINLFFFFSWIIYLQIKYQSNIRKKSSLLIIYDRNLIQKWKKKITKKPINRLHRSQVQVRFGVWTVPTLQEFCV